MLLSAYAAELITSDILLSAFRWLAMTDVIIHRFPGGQGRTKPWRLMVMYAAFGLAGLTGESPALVRVTVLMLLAWC